MVDVFISYSRTNQALVRRLAEAVKRLGYSVWWDDELPPHLSYGDVITEKIGEAKAAIVVWSEDAVASEWVRAEADVARNQKKLIQTSIDGRMPPMPFNQIQFAAIGDWQGEDDHPGWLKVRGSLEALCGPPGAATPPAPATPRRPATSPPAPTPATRPDPKLLPALIGVLALALLALGYFVWGRGGGAPAPPGNQVAAAPNANVAAPEAPAPPPPTDQRFNQAATIEAAQADIRSGPSAQGFGIGHVVHGDLITTYPQAGSWWQIRAPNGAVGYLERSNFRLLQASAPPAAGPAPRAAAPRIAAAPPPPPPAQAERRPQPPVQMRPINPGFPPGVINPRRYCKGPGRGTPSCRGMGGGF
jgi:hypothetical protein